jgi:DNA invertase Pin-like site-specific DNA recombinase
MTRTAVGYVRVSTDSQGERGYGLDAQRAAIEEEATRRGWTLERIYVDVASGKSTRRRPEYSEMLHALHNGQASVLIVAKLDRLSRSLVDFAGLMGTSQTEGWSVDALDIGVDTSTINGELIANIIMALAQWERRIIGERTSAALAQVKASGTVLGRPRTVDGETLRLIRILRDSGKGYHAIAKTLTAEHVPSGQGGKWHAQTVRKLFMRENTTNTRSP